MQLAHRESSAAVRVDTLAAGIWQDILSQAVTGEHIGMLNYMTLIGMYDEVDEKIEALEHAASELAHAKAFLAAGSSLGVVINNDVNATYWKRVRSAFLARARAGDVLGCVLVQEVMLESFAVATYQRVGEVAPGKLGQTFARIAFDEAAHVEHAMKPLQRARARDPSRFDAAVYEAHVDVMTVLAEMVAPQDRGGHCGLCHGSCVKSSLPQVGLSLPELRGLALRQYLLTLDEIGLPGDTTLAWVAQLPV